MLYADPEVAKHVLARWEIVGDALAEESKKVLLEYSVQREQCCHTGGGMAWDAKGNLYLTVGNNTSNAQGRRPTSVPGVQPWDDQRGAANTNDLRGKILRIHPGAGRHLHDSAGQPVSAGHAGHASRDLHDGPSQRVARLASTARPATSTGARSVPTRTKTPKSGRAATTSSTRRASRASSAGRISSARTAPIPFYDFFKEQPLAPKDPDEADQHLGQQHRACASCRRRSRRSSRIPTASPRSSPRSAAAAAPPPAVRSTAAPISPDAPRAFPDYYEGKWLAADLSRGWIMAIAMDENGDYQSMERFLPSYRPSEIIDIKFGPQGDLYVLDYGSTWFAKSADSQLVRIEYNGGNRPPVVADHGGPHRRDRAVQGRVLVRGHEGLRRRHAELRVERGIRRRERAAHVQGSEPDDRVRSQGHLRRDADGHRSVRCEEHRVARRDCRQRAASGDDRRQGREQDVLRPRTRR